VPKDRFRADEDGLPGAWRGALDAGDADRLARLEERLADEAQRSQIYPPRSLRYRALALVPPESVRVVIVGQDPYHRPGQAMGLAFSVPAGERLPPSLRNVYRELRSDLGIAIASHGDLTSWTAEGVLLLNTALTVEQGKPGSHASYGWQDFTGAILRHVARASAPTVFLLWGRHAQSSFKSVDARGHLVLAAGHPSPYSAHLFLGCRHFSQANAFLGKQGRGVVRWELADPGRPCTHGHGVV